MRSVAAGPSCRHLLRLAAVLAFASALACSAQDNSATKKTDAPDNSFRVGGQSIILTSPVEEMVEVGSDNRVILEVVVPESNRLIAGYVLKTEQAVLHGAGTELTRYAMVQVPRQGEFADVSADDFKQIADGAGKQLGAAIDSSVKEGETEFNRRMKSMNLDSLQATLDKPVQLGRLFARGDAFGFGMIMSVTMNGKTTKMVAGINLLRVRNRVLFAYVYSVYKDESTVEWMRNTSQDWADSILRANGQ